MQRSILAFLVSSLISTSLAYACDTGFGAKDENELALTTWMQSTSCPNSAYNTKLPTEGEIRTVTDFLKNSPQSTPGIMDTGQFYNLFLIVIKECKQCKPGKLEDLNHAASTFFSYFHQHANNWLVDQTQDDSLISQFNMKSMKSIHETYSKLFEKQFLIFQRVANHYFAILGKNGGPDPESCFGTTGYIQKGKDSSGKPVESQLGFIKDKNGYLPFRVLQSPSIIEVKLNYGDPLVYKDQHCKRSVLIQNNQIIPHTGIILGPSSSNVLPLCFGLYSGNTCAVWPKSQYCNPGNKDSSRMTGLLAAFNGIVDWDDVIATKKTCFYSFPSTEKEQYAFSLLLLEGLIEAKTNTTLSQDTPLFQVIQSLEAAASLEELKTNVEEALFSVCFEEEKQKAALDQNKKDVAQPAKKIQAPPKTPQKSRGRQKTKPNNSRTDAPSQADQPKTNEDEIMLRAQKLMEKYKVEGRKKFLEVKGMLNTVLKDKETFKKAGVDLPKALESFSVKIAGSHITVHKEGADTTATLVKKHGQKDKGYFASDINQFFMKFFVQIFSHSLNSDL